MHPSRRAVSGGLGTILVAVGLTGGAPADVPGIAPGPPKPPPSTRDYRIDDGSAERSVILVAGNEPRPTLWLNAFHALPGGDLITSIGVTWGRQAATPSGVPVQAATTVLLYQDDPSNDGDPRTATLLDSQQIPNGAPAASIDTGVFLDVPIPPTAVHGTFFVGALYEDPGVGAPAPLDTSNPDLAGRSWIFSSAENAVDVQNLGSPLNFGGLIEAPPFGLSGNWLLRARGSLGLLVLTVDRATLPADTGGELAFAIAADSSNSGRAYLLLCSTRGIPVTRLIGHLDADGRSSVLWNVPPLALPSPAASLPLTFTCTLFEEAAAVSSEAVQVSLTR